MANPAIPWATNWAEAVTGTRLFRRATDLQTLQAVAECQVTPPSRFTAGLPRGLDEVLLKALSRDRTQRYATAEELGESLEPFIADAPEAAPAALGGWVQRLFSERTPTGPPGLTPRGSSDVRTVDLSPRRGAPLI